MAIAAHVFILFVTLGFQSVATTATGSADRAGLVDIGGDRKMYRTRHRRLQREDAQIF
jgi:hypothetical protein